MMQMVSSFRAGMILVEGVIVTDFFGRLTKMVRSLCFSMIVGRRECWMVIIGSSLQLGWIRLRIRGRSLSVHGIMTSKFRSACAQGSTKTLLTSLTPTPSLLCLISSCS